MSTAEKMEWSKGHSEDRKPDWQTPSYIFEAALDILQEPQFDLDPCAPDEQSTEFVKQRYAISGIERSWIGSVYMNPPGRVKGGGTNPEDWYRRLSQGIKSGEVTSAVCCVFNAQQMTWISKLKIIEKGWRIHFPDHRVKYVDPDPISGAKKKIAPPAYTILLSYGCKGVPKKDWITATFERIK